MGGEARIGCSGWQYREWRGVAYPAELPQRRWFEHYAATFDTVELNTTFYRLPAPSTVEAWRDRAPDGFRYAVKVGRFGTHRKKLRDPATWLANHLDRAERLDEHLGPQLLQLPPHWHRDAPRLDAMLAAAPERHRWAVELRDPSWLHDEVFEVLRAHRAALCIHDLLDDHPWERTADWTYLRFHGPEATTDAYGGRYGPERLEAVADRLDEWRTEGTDVWAYFNNDRGGHAWTDARWLAERLGPSPRARRGAGA
ncbi:MAG: DUF72 domain-containing protein [Acidimicrobiales bacterium]